MTDLLLWIGSLIFWIGIGLIVWVAVGSFLALLLFRSIVREIEDELDELERSRGDCE